MHPNRSAPQLLWDGDEEPFVPLLPSPVRADTQFKTCPTASRGVPPPPEHDGIIWYLMQYAVGKLTANRRKEGVHDQVTQALSKGSFTL